MSGIITDIKFQKSNCGRVDIYLDHRFAFSLQALEAARFQKGQRIDAQQIAELREESHRHEAYRRALRYLGYRPRSRREVERHLRAREFPADIIGVTIDRLVDEGLIDDKAFASLWLDRRKPRKAAAVFRCELEKKGIEDPIISEVISQIDDDAEAKQIVDRRLYRRWAHLPPEDLKKKLVNFLRRRGYSYDVSFKALRYAREKLDRDNQTDV
jgi:regulatory protein